MPAKPVRSRAAAKPRAQAVRKPALRSAARAVPVSEPRTMSLPFLVAEPTASDRLLATAVGGSIIFTQNQMGGQVAHSITNVGPQPRQITQAAANELIADLRRYPPESLDIVSD